VPAILLEPAFEDLVRRGLVGGPMDDLRMTGAGEAVVDRLGDAFRAWILDNLPDVGEDEVAAVDAVIARIVRRVVREEAESRAIVSLGIAPTDVP
jgi:hypothetical protein